MTAAERAALDRVIAAVRSNWLLAIPLSAKWPTWEADAHAIADAGLTAKQAREIVENLDTPDEKAMAKQYIAQLATPADAEILLGWLAAECKRALANYSVNTNDSTGKHPVHATTFLRRNARVTSHVLMSSSVGSDSKQEIIDYNAAQGYGALYVYAANDGDYGRREVRYNPATDKDHWRYWLSKVKASGASVIMWGCADDSPKLAKMPFQWWEQYWGAIHRDLGDLIDEWVTGLEVNEYWSQGETRDRTNLLKRITGKPVGVHCTGISAINHADGADAYYLQTGFGKSPSQVAAAVREAKAKFKGRVIAAEYHKSGETDAARAIGDAAIAAGADGVGNGCSRAGMSVLIARAVGQNAPPVPPGYSPGSHGAALSGRYTGGRLRDVAWSPAVDRGGWPTKSVDGATCDGLLYGCEIGGGPRKVEWIKRGAQSAHTQNAWAAKQDRKYNQGWTGGERCRFEVRDVAGKLRDQAHAFEAVLG